MGGAYGESRPGRCGAEPKLEREIERERENESESERARARERESERARQRELGRVEGKEEMERKREKLPCFHHAIIFIEIRNKYMIS